ncbi:MAG: UvrD-helicase domain-containing protein, partial [Gammaproteobacteria bacterium]
MNASTAQKLDPGIHLIEANAGTGKTYRLTDTCLQLLQQPDAGVTMDQFLVLTFTRAAASELTGRIQERVREGLAQHPTDTPTQPAQQLEQALTQIDNATICTTDAFYYLLFQDYGLELGTPFALPAPSDAADNLKRACYLWWRQQIQNQNYQPLQQLDSLGLEDPIKLADWLEKSRQYCGASLVFLDDGASDELDQGISHHNKATATWMRQMDLDISRLELEGLSAGQRPDFSLLAHRLLDRIKAEDTNAHKLRERIRARWKVVLIDESQDNSPIQFEIFRQLFGPPGKRWLFFI